MDKEYEYDWKKVAQVGGIEYSQHDIDYARVVLHDCKCEYYPISGRAVMGMRDEIIMLAYDLSVMTSNCGKTAIRKEITKRLDEIIYGFVRDVIKESEVKE